MKNIKTRSGRCLPVKTWREECEQPKQELTDFTEENC
jgi:hypothetical protein